MSPSAVMSPSPCFRVATLASGSSGNSIYAECPDGALIIDAGISGRRIANAIETVGGSIDDVEAIIVTHDHRDHSGCAGVITRRHRVAAFVTEGTHNVRERELRGTDVLTLYRPGEVFSAGGFTVHTIPTPHDAQEPAVLILERKGVMCGIFTDLGHVTCGISDRFADLDAVVLESNYDPQMLKSGPYPWFLKERIVSDCGHISNPEAAELVRDHAGRHLRSVLLAHLSETNNTPHKAEECMLDIAGECIEEYGVDVLVAPRHVPSAFVEVCSRKKRRK